MNITKFPVGSKDKHPDFVKLVNYTMSVLANSSDISIATFSGSLGAITSVATATDSTLTNVDAIYSQFKNCWLILISCIADITLKNS